MQQANAAVESSSFLLTLLFYYYFTMTQKILESPAGRFAGSLKRDARGNAPIVVPTNRLLQKTGSCRTRDAAMRSHINLGGVMVSTQMSSALTTNTSKL